MTQEEPTGKVFSLKVAFACVLVFVAGLLAGQVGGADGGSDAEWVAALATLSALVAALFAARYTERQLEIESTREDARLLADKQAQASLVAAWPTGQSIGSPQEQDELTGETHASNIDRCLIAVRNASHVPVTNLVLDVSWVVQHPGRDPQRHHIGVYDGMRVLPPETTEKVWVGGGLGAPTPNPKVKQWCEVELHFTDSAGRDWERLASGPLILKNEPKKIAGA